MTDFRNAQRRLVAAGYEIGAVDGVAGPKTWAGILAYVATRQLSALLPFGEAAAIHLPAAGISDSTLRIANFVGQATHESGNFRYMREIWGPTDVQSRYEGRAALGNTHPGDGRRYCGRGIFQITGRANYRSIGQALGLDLEGTPTLAESPAIALRTAVQFWTSHRLNDLADAGHEDDITRRINGGLNGIIERRRLVARAKGLFA